MPANVFWYYTDLVIYIELIGSVTVDENNQVDREVLQLMSDSPYDKVYIVFDCRKIKNLPHMRSLQAQQFPQNPKYGTAVALGLPAALTFVANVMSRYWKIRGVFKSAKNFQEGLEWLTKQSPALATMPIKDPTEASKSI
jgi:hypothetical protein